MAMKDLTSSIYCFEDLIRGNFLYVDKTEYIWQLVRPAKEMYFLSRPRRFGKSLALSTFKAVFEGKREFFKGLAIYDKPFDWKPHPIIHLDMNGRDFSTPEKMEDSFCQILLEQAKCSGVTLTSTASVSMFHALIGALYEKGGDVVLLLDEYDRPILNNIEKKNRAEFLAALKLFYSVIKEKTAMLRFVFITGVSKFCHVSLFSELNNLTDISMNETYATMLGYTQEELEAYFADRMKSLKTKLSGKVLRQKIKTWYDGYRFSANARTVYNPVSLASFFNNGGKFSNYWFSTGTPSFLIKLAKSRKFDFETALSVPLPEITFNAFEIDSIDPLTLLYQTGYVTIKSTRQQFNQTWYCLDFPNQEVSSSFNTYLLHSYTEKTQRDVVCFTSEFAIALDNGDLDSFRTLLESFFAGIPYSVHKKNESYFQVIFFAIFRLLGEYIEAESCTNDGRTDAVVQTTKAIYLFEFKLDKNPMALDQMKQKEYFRKYLADKRRIHLIGINFDTHKGNLCNWQTELIQ